MAIRVARVSSAVKCSEGSTGRPLSNGRAAHAAAATQRTVATPRRAWGRSPPAPLRFLPRRQPRPVFQHRGRPQCYNEVGYGQGGARPSGKVKGSWGGTPSPPRSMDESIEGQKVLVESYEELCYEGSEFRQGKEPLHSEHDIEEQVVLRSMWDLKIPEIDERKQTRKMIQVGTDGACPSGHSALFFQLPRSPASFTL